MKTLVDFLQTVGKTVFAVSHSAWSEGIVISFTDDTFTVIKAEINDYENYAELHEGTSAGFNVLDGRSDEMIRVGVVSPEEWDRMQLAQEQARQAEQERQERRAYAQLRAKYQ